MKRIFAALMALLLFNAASIPATAAAADTAAALSETDQALYAISEELREITGKMSEIGGSETFRARAETAALMLKRWNDFAVFCMTGGMDSLITGYAEMFTESAAASQANAPASRESTAGPEDPAAFAAEVLTAYETYISRLSAAGDGLDAMFKAIYLTHALEGEASEMITEFCSRMREKNETYGRFVAGVLKKTETATAEQKQLAADNFAAGRQIIDTALTNGLTGNPGYCYITNSDLRLFDSEIRGSVSMRVRKSETGELTVSGTSSGPMQVVFGEEFSGGAYLLDTVSAELLSCTLLGSGKTLDYHYLEKNIPSGSAKNYGRLLTGYGEQAAFYVKSETAISVSNVCGELFEEGLSYGLPSGADSSGLAEKRMISGSYFDLKAGELMTGRVLCGAAAYYKTGLLRSGCEAALLAEPADHTYASFDCAVNAEEDGTLNYTKTVTASYNAVMCLPVMRRNVLSASADVNPLSSLELLNEELRKNSPAEEQVNGETAPIEENAGSEDPEERLTEIGNKLIIGGSAVIIVLLLARCFRRREES